MILPPKPKMWCLVQRCGEPVAPGYVLGSAVLTWVCQKTPQPQEEPRNCTLLSKPETCYTLDVKHYMNSSVFLGYLPLLVCSLCHLMPFDSKPKLLKAPYPVREIKVFNCHKFFCFFKPSVYVVYERRLLPHCITKPRRIDSFSWYVQIRFSCCNLWKVILIKTY